MPRFEYGPVLESAELAQLRPWYGLFYQGEFVEPADGARLTSVNPATGAPLAEFALAAPADVDTVVRSARSAYQQGWGQLPGRERAKYLFRIAQLLVEHSPELAVLESLDRGKPIRQTRDTDLPQAAAQLFYYAGWADKLRYAGLRADPRPFGVAAQVLGWHSPLLTLVAQVGPALASGNTVVVKPSATTPLTALRFAELCQQADLPPGVVNVVTGGEATGAALVGHPAVEVVAFAGAGESGKQVARSVAGTGKRLTLGSRVPPTAIVFADAPMAEAVESIAGSQICCGGTRLLAQESIYDELLSLLRHRLTAVRVGDPLDRNADLGPVSSSSHLAQLQAAVRAEGTVEPWSPRCQLPESGFWLAPTMITDITQAHQITRQEIFGPVLSVLSFRTPDEAVALAHQTSGQAAVSVWTEKGSLAFWAAGQLSAEVVWANTCDRVDPTAPTGAGREGGRHTLEVYLA